MNKRLLLAILAVFVAWQVLDFVIHGLMLMKTYEATAQLWRPMEEMKMGLMRLVGLVGATVFVVIYAAMIRPKSVGAGVIYGTLFGLGTGFSMGFGTYAVMPIPFPLAMTWFLGSVVEAAVGGWLAGWIVKPALAAPSTATAPSR